MQRIAVGAFVVLAAFTAAAKPPESNVEKPEATLESLGSGPIEVTIEGEAAEAFLSKKKCVYFEWTYGVREGAEWQTRWSGFHSETPLVVVTPKGKLTLRPNQLRTYLAASFEQTWTRQDQAKAPEVVKKKLKDEEAITAVEHCLEAGRKYHALLHIDTYDKPPRPGEGAPSQGRNAVLWVSDVPFGEDGKPKRPLTPAYQGWTY